MDILQSLPDWINQCDGIFLFGYVSEQDKSNILLILKDQMSLYDRMFHPVIETSGNVGVSDMEVSSLRMMKLKDKIFVSDLGSLINVTGDSTHNKMILEALSGSCQKNKNCLVLLCPMYKDISMTVGNDYKYSKIPLYLAMASVSLKNGVISVNKLRWGSPSDYLPLKINQYVRDSKIDDILR
jgi:hypothetical protein